MALIPLAVTFIVMYLLLMRPQQQRVRRQKALVSSLRVGDDVLTAGGLYGTIARLDDTDAVIEVAPGVEVRVLRLAITKHLVDDDDEDGPSPEGPAYHDGERE